MATNPRVLSARIAEAVEAELVGGELHPQLEGALFGPKPASVREGNGGLLVTDVPRGSAAWETGLRPGDIVTHVNRQTMQDLKSLSHMVQANPHHLTLQMRRGASSVYILIR